MQSVLCPLWSTLANLKTIIYNAFIKAIFLFINARDIILIFKQLHYSRPLTAVNTKRIRFPLFVFPVRSVRVKIFLYSHLKT